MESEDRRANIALGVMAALVIFVLGAATGTVSSSGKACRKGIEFKASYELLGELCK